MIHQNSVAKLILSEWASELSAKLGRSETEILQRGLTAGDFRPDEELRLTFPDNSMVHFQYAFFVVKPTGRRIAVFTEQCGYHVFPSAGTSVEQITRLWMDDGE